MPRKSSTSLTPAEWKIMKIVWELKSGAARDIYRVAAEMYDWSPSTAKTVLSRLVEKGYLKTTRVGNSYLYRPVQTPLKSLSGAADTLLENAIEGTTGPLLAYMVKKSDLSSKDLTELRALLDEHKES